jgi:hypothetical protein
MKIHLFPGLVICQPISVAARPEVCWNAGVAGSNPTRGMDVCARVVLFAGSERPMPNEGPQKHGGNSNGVCQFGRQTLCELCVVADMNEASCHSSEGRDWRTGRNVVAGRQTALQSP